MKAILGVAALALYFLAGLVCLAMAYSTLLAKRYLPFHEAAAGKKWEELDSGLQDTILALLRLSGGGFLVVGLMLLVLPIVNYFHPDIVTIFAVPILSLAFCFCLFLFNFQLSRKTGADTPWQSSLGAIIVIAIGFGLSLAGL